MDRYLNSMQNSRCQEIQMVWEKIRGAFELLPSRGPKEKSGQIASEFITGFTALFTPYLGRDEVAKRLALPEDYLCFLTLNNNTWRQGGEYGLYLYGANAILGGTSYDPDLELYAEGRPQDAGMWIAIGHWSDRHDMMLCCDRKLPLFGAIIDCNDDHPWMADGSFYPQSVRGEPDFAHFLAYLQSLEEDLT